MHAAFLRSSIHDYIFFALSAQVAPLHNWRHLGTEVTLALLAMTWKGRGTPVDMCWQNRIAFANWRAEELRAKLMRVAETQKVEERRRVHFEGEEDTPFAKHGKNKMPKTWRELEGSFA